jgi:hypothetical protein
LIGLVAVLLLGACAADSATATTAPEPATAIEASRFEVLHTQPLPAALRWASDVRWASDDTVWVAAGPDGVFEIAVEEGGSGPRRLGADGGGPDGLLLAASDGMVAAAVGFGPVSWTRADSPSNGRQTAPLATIIDFDLWRGRGVLLGARRDAEGNWSPEGGLLWLGSLAEDLADVEATMFAESGPQALEVALCGTLGLGAVRFFADGRYAVVPGVQPGAFLYASDGELLHAWRTEPIGFYDRCELDWEEARQLKRDPRERIRWWRRHPTLDELLPWGDGPALIVRRPRQDGTSWQLVALSERGISEPVDLPVVTASTASHLKADLRGDRLAVLISEFGPPDEPPQEPPRLVVLRRLGDKAEAGKR